MLSQGEFIHRDETYQISIVEKPTAKRIDIYKQNMKLANPNPQDVLVSVFENLETGKKHYFGEIDMYYLYERLVREARLFRFKEEEIDAYDDFEEGKILYVCNQKTERFEYNYKTENMQRIYAHMRTPEATATLTVTDMDFTMTAAHLTLNYQELVVSKADFNEDSLILSRIATLSELRAKFDLSWLKGKDYVWMDSLGQLRDYLRELSEYLRAYPEALVAIDTETTGLNMYNYPEGSEERSRIVSIVISWKKDFSLYIPIAHKYEKNLDEKKVMKMLTPLIELCPLLTQNGLFDYKAFMAYQAEDDKLLKLNIKHDLLLENYILQPNPKRGDRSLKANVWKHLAIKQLSLTDLFPATKEGKTEIRFELLPKETALIYACPDVDLLLYLHEKIYPNIPDLSKDIYNIECKFMPIAAEAEYYGLRINMEMFQKEKKLCEELTEELKEAMYKLSGYRFNLNSNDQVANLLYNKLGCDILIRSKSNPAIGSTSSKALKSLAKVKAETPSDSFTDDLVQMIPSTKPGGKPEKRTILKAEELNNLKYPAVKVLLEYRNYSKLLSSFFNSIEESNKGGRLFNWINQTGAQTGRIISPLQTLPPFIKRMIMPDTDDHGWLVMDYKQIELRLMFGLAKEQALIEQATNPDNDIHRIVAARLYHMKLWEIYKDLRSKSKGLNFGIPYSLGDYSLATTLYGFPKNEAHKVEIVNMAKKDRADFFSAMPRVERLFIDAKNQVKEQGFLFTYLGRGFYYDSIFEETNQIKLARILRQCGNAMIQGFGADIFKTGCVKLQSRIKKRGWDRLIEGFDAETGESQGKYPKVRQAFFVHDEDGLPYHKKSINPLQVLYEVRKSMQIEIEGFPPFFVGAAIVDTWAEAKDDKYEIPTALLEQWCEEVEQGMHTEPLENPKEWVYNEIKKFNEQSFRDHFEELKQQLVEEGKEVNEDNIAKIFRHDILTHDVVGMYKQSEYEDIYMRKPNHEEHLEFAVKRYMQDYNILTDGVAVDSGISLDNLAVASISEDATDFDYTGAVDGMDVFSLISSEIDEIQTNHGAVIYDMDEYRYSDKAIDKDELISLTDDLDEFENPRDTNMVVMFDDTDDDEYAEINVQPEQVSFGKEEYEKRTEEIKEGFSSYISTLARKKIIKVDLVSEQTIKILDKYILSQHKEDGLYEVSLYRAGKLIPTKYHVDQLDDALIDLLLSKSNEELSKILEEIS